MNYDYQYLVPVRPGQRINVSRVNAYCAQYPNNKVLIEVDNTKNISIDDLRALHPNVAIRVAGGYDSDRVNRNRNVEFSNGETGKYYHDAVIYTRGELVQILKQIEKIEAGIFDNWSPFQKIVYIYDQLKRTIMYDPKKEEKTSSEIRSLRGLVTKQTVCAGYAMIFKELLDRQGIECEYVEGYKYPNKKGAHAWNIVVLNGKKYPIDLTWDNGKYIAGLSKSHSYLGQNVSEFSREHYPHSYEKTQDYLHTLSEFNIEQIESLSNAFSRSNNYTSTTFYGTRNNGTRFVVAQVGTQEVNGTMYYRYYYADIDANGKLSEPLLLYGKTNISMLVYAKKFNKKIPDGYEDALCNIMLSKENIRDSLNRHTHYIGAVNKNINGNSVDIIKSVSEIEKNDFDCNLSTHPTRRYMRSDGTFFIIQQMLNKPVKINNIDIMRYDVFEMVREDGKAVLRKNTIFTERNIFRYTQQRMVDEFLSRERLDRKVRESGGYIGYFDDNGMRISNAGLMSYFSIAKHFDHVEGKKDEKLTIPTFDELRDLAMKYEIYVDSSNALDQDVSKIKIREINTKRLVNDSKIFKQAMFANLWLSSAGMKYFEGERRNGERYAFSDVAKELYNVLCNGFAGFVKKDGVIDTISVFKKIEEVCNYKYAQDIVVNLFRTPYQANVINQFFREAYGVKGSKNPVPLYNMYYAGNIAYGDQSRQSSRR